MDCRQYLGLAILAIIGFNIHLQMESQKKLSDSDVTLKNIEAYTNDECNGPITLYTCYFSVTPDVRGALRNRCENGTTSSIHYRCYEVRGFPSVVTMKCYLPAN
jgi:hypothetical protein